MKSLLFSLTVAVFHAGRGCMCLWWLPNIHTGVPPHFLAHSCVSRTQCSWEAWMDELWCTSQQGTGCNACWPLTCMTRTRLVQCETVSSLAYKSATLRGYLNNPFMWVIKCTVQRRGKKNILISHSQFPCSSLQVSSLFILVWFVSLPRALCVEASQM